MAEEKLQGIQRLDVSSLGKDISEANKLLKRLDKSVQFSISEDIKKEVDKSVTEIERISAAAKEAVKAMSKIGTVSSGGSASGSKRASGKRTENEQVKALANGYIKLYEAQTKLLSAKPGTETRKYLESLIGTLQSSVDTKKTSDALDKQAQALERVTKAREKYNLAEAKTKDRDATQQKAKQQKEHAKQLDELLSVQKEIATLESKDPRSVAGRQEKQRQINDLRTRELNLTNQIEQLESSGLSNDAKKNENARKLVEHTERIRQSQLGATTASKGFESVLGRMADTMIRMASMAIWNTLSSAWQEATSFAKEYYDALNEIRIVTGDSEAEAQRMGSNFIQQAQKMSVNSKDIASAAVEYYRQGLSDSQVEDRLEWTIKYAKVAGIEFEEAAELMTAATNSMDLSAQQVADVFSYLGDASASGADEIGIAMQKASASAQEAGVSFEWLGSYIAAVSENTRQAPEVIGTAFNSIMARLHNIKASGFNEEDSTRINDVAKAQATLPKPLELVNSLTGEWVDMSTLFEEIAKQWDSQSDKQRAYIATTVAGIRQQNIFLTLMADMSKAGENASRVYDLYNGALEASGSVTQKYAIYQESVTASFDSLKAKWQEFVSLLEGGGLFKDLYEFAGKLIDILTAGTKATDGWNIKLLAISAGIATLLVVMPKIASAVALVKGAVIALNTALHATNVAMSKTKVGLVISAITAVIGVVMTLTGGVSDLNEELEETNEVDYSSTLSGQEQSIKSLKGLISQYETLSSKVNKTSSDYSEMESVINEIIKQAPKYETALQNAQGNISETISITNAALKEQEQLMRSIQAVQAMQMLGNKDNLNSWQTTTVNYRNMSKVFKELTEPGSNPFHQNSFYMGDATDAESYANSKLYFLRDQNDLSKVGISNPYARDLLAYAEYLGESFDIETATLEDARALLFNLYNQTMGFGGGRSVIDSLENDLNVMINEVSGLYMASKANDPRYLEMTKAQQEEVARLTKEQIDFHTRASTPETAIRAMDSGQWNTVIDRVLSDTSIDLRAIMERIASTLTDSSVLDNPTTKSQYEAAVESWLNNMSSDSIMSALEKMKGFYGDQFDSFISDLINSSDSADILEGWNDSPLDSMTGQLNDILRSAVGDASFYDSVWSHEIGDWADLIVSALQDANYSDKDIEKGMTTFAQGIRDGIVTLETLDRIFSQDKNGEWNQAANFSDVVGNLHSVQAATNNVGESLNNAQKKWKGFIDTASSGDVVGALQDVYDESKRISEVQGNLALALTNGNGSSDAWRYLSDMYGGVTDKTMLEAMANMDIDGYMSGLNYLFENQYQAGANQQVSQLKEYISDSGIDLIKFYTDALNSAALSDNYGTFFQDGLAASLFSNIAQYDENGALTNLSTIVSVFNAITTAIDEGTLSWARLSREINDGTDAVELYKLATAKVSPGGGDDGVIGDDGIPQKWKTRREQLLDPEERQSVIDDLRQQSLDYSRSLADFVMVQTESIDLSTRKEAMARLYEKYGTTSTDLLEGLIESEASQMQDAIDYLGSYIGSEYYNMIGMSDVLFDPDLAPRTELYNLATLSGDSSAADSLNKFIDAFAESSDFESVEKVITAYYMQRDALEAGTISWSHLNDAAGDNIVTMDEIIKMINTAEFQKMLSDIEGMSSASDEKKASFMEGIFGKPGDTDGGDSFDSFKSAVKYYADIGDTDALETIQEAFSIDDETFSKLKEGAEISAESLRKLQRQAVKLDASRLPKNFKETTKAAWDLEDGLISVEEAYELFNDEAKTSKKATEEYNSALEKMASGSEVTADDVATQAEFLGYVSPEALLNNWSGVGSDLANELAIGQSALDAQNAAAFIHITGTSSCDFSNLQNGLLSTQNLSAQAIDLLQKMGMFTVETIPMTQEGYLFNPETGTWSKSVITAHQQVLRPTGANPLGSISKPASASKDSTKKGGGGGGGGGGGNKTDPTADEQKMVDHMSWMLDLIEDALDRNEAIMSRFETQGYLTGVINQLEQEAEYLEERGRLYESNISKLEQEMAVRKETLSGLKEGTTEYDTILAELEILQDAYKEYSLALLENANALLENEEAIREQKEAIRDMEIDIREELLDAIEDRQDREEDALDALIEMQDAVQNAIISRHEKERDEIIRTNELKLESLQEEMDALDEAFEKRKELAEEEDKQAELLELEKKYSRIVADPTRAKEALDIQNQILELRDEIAWDAAEKEIEAQKDSLDQQMTSLEDYQEYIENYYEDLLENPRNFLDEVNTILSMSHEQILEWLMTNSEDYQNSQDASREEMQNGWSDTLDTMSGVMRTHWEEIEAIIAQGDAAILEFLQTHRQDYLEAGKLQAEAFTDQWKEQLDDLRKAYLDIYEEVNKHPFLETTQTSTGNSSSGGGSGGSKKKNNTTTTTTQNTGGNVSGGASFLKNNAVNNKINNVIAYAEGGIADFTGPAWLDGSRAKPERVLSPIQTELFESMVVALQKIATVRTPTISPVHMKSSAPSGANSFGDIIINVDSIGKDADYKEIARRVGEAMLEQMNKGTVVGGMRYSF